MSTALNRLFTRLIGAVLALCLIFTPFVPATQAARISMSGDYPRDTISVIDNLKETISSPQDEEGRSEAIAIITAYISRYRNRSRVNRSVSFTTMQTALNSLAGHYKTFGKRPISDELKNRLDNQLTKVEKLVLQES